MWSQGLKDEMKMKIKIGVWGFIIGAIVAMIIGFTWGGWITSSTSQQIAKEAVSASQVASQAAICVTQFVKDPKYTENLAAVQKLDSWDRQQFIEKGGWDKMPGQEKAGSSVAQACAKGLEVLASK